MDSQFDDHANDPIAIDLKLGQLIDYFKLLDIEGYTHVHAPVEEGQYIQTTLERRNGTYQ